MPREIITVQVGQCGNQIATRFWDLALREHASRGILFDDSMSSFFKFENRKNSEDPPIIKARSVIVDMEEGVINQILKSDIGELFDTKQLIRDVSGAGNNWAHGFYEYGSLYTNTILEKINKVLEECDSPQCFMLTHSIGGGTGSGLGSYIVKTLNENYPDLYKFTASVFPSKDDDVITSPYNSILSLNQLINNADCVLPIDNQSLIDICNKVESETSKEGKSIFKSGNSTQNKNILDADSNGVKQVSSGKKKPYDKMNSIIAHLLCNLTCSMRFEGTLNVDINDITMNLVPYPRLHFILSAISPLYHVLDKKLEPRKSDQIFADVFDKDHGLISIDNLYNGTYLASALIARGDLAISDIMYNIEKQKKNLKMVSWNFEGFKIGLCDQPPVNMKYGLLNLSNNTAISNSFEKLRDRFMILYKRKAHIHHYTEYMKDQGDFDEAINNVQNLIEEYNTCTFKKENDRIKINPII
jgi:tubulin epsilon